MLKKLASELASAICQGCMDSSAYLKTIDQQAKRDMGRQLELEAANTFFEMASPIFTILQAAGYGSEAKIETYLHEAGIGVVEQLWKRSVLNRIKAVNYQLAIIDSLADSEKSTIVDVSILDGDSHNDGHRPLKLKLRKICGGFEELVFKSISPASYIFLKQAADILWGHLGLVSPMSCVKWSGDDFFVRKYVPSSNKFTKAQLKSYFYSYGSLCSLSNFLQVTDLHFENIIATLHGPVIIDAEFIFSKNQARGEEWSYKNCGLFEKVTSPISQCGKFSFIEPNISSLNGDSYLGYSKNKLRSEHLVFDEAGFLVDVSRYFSDIYQGMIDADAVIKKNKYEILEGLSVVANKRHSIRCWVRSTAYYRVLQLKLWIPVPKKFTERRRLIFEKLNTLGALPANLSPYLRTISLFEMEEIEKGDIPYFLIDSENGNLYGGKSVLIPEYGFSTILAIDAAKKYSPPKRGRKDIMNLARMI